MLGLLGEGCSKRFGVSDASALFANDCVSRDSKRAGRESPPDPAPSPRFVGLAKRTIRRAPLEAPQLVLSATPPAVQESPDRLVGQSVTVDVTVELKAVEKLLPVHEVQILVYLKLSGFRLAI